MDIFVGLDVSLDETSVCILDDTGQILRESKVDTEPGAIRTALKSLEENLRRVGLEASSLSPWLATELRKLGLPIIVVEAKHMKAALGAMRNKTDKNDARGIAQMMRTGWFREIHVKSAECHRMRILLANRRLLKRKFLDIENAIRGTLKVFGVKLGKTTRTRFERDLRERLADEERILLTMSESMLLARRTLWQEYLRCHELVLQIVGADSVCRRLMTVPGVGPVTALAFASAIDDPRRFRRSKVVGAHFGLTPRRYQSGTVDYNGRISKCGDPEVRTLLYEAASSLLQRVKKWSALKAWGMSIQRRSGLRRAIVAVAWKLAVILHRMWIDGTEFQYSRPGSEPAEV